MKTLKAVLIGAGSRGGQYAQHMKNLPGKYELVAVAEPVEVRRKAMQEMWNLPDEMCFTDWKDLAKLGKIADLAVIATMDRDHFAQTMEMIEQGYNILVEKPLSDKPEECAKMADAAEKKGVKVVVCTVLRYTQLFMSVKKLIDDGKVGEIISVNHEECVGNKHQSHSYVRGRWGNEARSSNMLLAKSCHDIDLMQWLIGKQAKRVQSFGALSYFRKENMPEGAPEYCIDGCPVGDTCPYSAVKLYLDDKENLWFREAATTRYKPSDEEVERAIRTTQYGKCVFQCDNDVVDHQTVNVLFEDDVTLTFTMAAFNKGGRYLHVMGTKGEIHAELNEEKPIQLYEFGNEQTTEIPVTGKEGIVSGHGGGDPGMIATLWDYLAGDYTDNTIPEIRQSADNHLLTFAAEEARLTGSIVDFDEYKSKF